MNVKRFDQLMIILFIIITFLFGMLCGQQQKKKELTKIQQGLFSAKMATEVSLTLGQKILNQYKKALIEVKLVNTRNYIHKRQNKNLLIEIDGLRTLINKDVKLRKFIRRKI